MPAHSSALNRSKIGFRSEAGATLLDVRAAMTYLRHSLTEACFDPLDIASSEIVIAEILNNVIKHAQENQDDGWFDLQCEIAPEALHVTCKDNGAAMPGGVPPLGVLPEIGCSVVDLPEGGWGWSLVRTLTTSLNYVRIEPINLVSFTIPKTSDD